MVDAYFTCCHCLVHQSSTNTTNRVKILLVLSWLVIQLQVKMKLGVPSMDLLGVDGVVAFVRTAIRETQTCSNDYVCTLHISIFIINQKTQSELLDFYLWRQWNILIFGPVNFQPSEVVAGHVGRLFKRVRQ